MRKNVRGVTLRSAFLSGMLTVVMVAILIIGLISVISLERNVRREAQERVNNDLRIVNQFYEEKLRILAESLEREVLLFTNVKDAGHWLERIGAKYGLTVLNVCDMDGHPITGSYADLKTKVPIKADPVLRKALSGKLSWGTVRLESDRLFLEGGKALPNAMLVYELDQENQRATNSALFEWFACPIKDDRERVTALVYGGRGINYNFELVDELRSLVFGDEHHQGKPVGTVTFFLDGIRVATNVLGPGQRRAVGTYVSKQVQHKVLEQGKIWQDRAWVVDNWYISAYQPLVDPDGRIIGMIYVGLLEAPYRILRNRLVINILWPLLVVLAATVAISLYLVGRITAPVRDLSEAASNLGQGKWDYRLKDYPTFREIGSLGRTFKNMQAAISERDRTLRDKNEILEQTNRNYMEMLGFVTHELKSPLAAIQSMIAVLVDGLVGKLPEQVQMLLTRIRRNCEELQDMVKNYLDLSRVERGEMVAHKAELDFYSEVVKPVTDQTAQLFHSRMMSQEVNCGESLKVLADPELMRIALTNYLTNAAKYGREGGKARLRVECNQDQLEVWVWNEGEGFKTEDHDKLFHKFSRLRNPNTAEKRGSGLGLFLCRQILDLHNGEVWAKSSPGEWAEFGFHFPSA